MTHSKPQKMWAVYRDDEIYLIKPKKLHARHERDHYDLNGVSKHKWTVRPVLVHGEGMKPEGGG